MFRFVSIAVALVASACGPTSPDLPETSAEAEQLRWLEHADPVADVRERVERQRDTRFLSVYGFSTPGAFGLDDNPEVRQLIQRHGELTLEGTTDIISSREHLRLRSKAHAYVKQYNEQLLRYLRDIPISNQAMQLTASKLRVHALSVCRSGRRDSAHAPPP